MQGMYSRRDVLKGAVVAGGVLGIASLAGCASPGQSTSAASAGGMKSGTYTASAAGMRGELTVFVTVDDASILTVEVIDDEDTPVIRDAAIVSVTSRIVEQQNIEVDAVAGATMTSMGIKTAVAAALEVAQADLSAFKKGSDAPKEKQKGQSESFDLVIAGSGMAGLSAAVNALKINPDLKVLVLEKQAYTGGSTRVCGGGIWAVNAPINKVAGQDSTKEEYIAFMEKRSAPTALNTGLMSNIYDISSEAFTDLYNWGLPISANSWSLGNPDSQLPSFDSTKNLNSNWETGNSGLADFMTTLAEMVGVEIRLTSKVIKIVGEANAVSAVEVEDSEKIYMVNAKKVILATGGFTRSPELIKKYAPDYERAFAFTGSGSTGDGITLAEELGATVIGNGMMGLTGINPSVGYYGPYGGAVWSAQCNVNANGEDFGMKGTFYGDTLKLILEQPNSCCYGIYDATSPILDRLEAGSELGLIFKYDSLDSLASGQAIDAAGLKKQAEANKVSKAPFFCIVRKPLFIGSIPGLAVDDHCGVLGKEGKVIENLFGAGELVYANVFDGAYPASGTGVGTSCYTGAIASNAALAAM